jgi:hypothetical protein
MRAPYFTLHGQDGGIGELLLHGFVASCESIFCTRSHEKEGDLARGEHGAIRAGVIAIATLSLIGCSSLTARNPIKEAKALNAGAEHCLLDVRDKGLKYETSQNCQKLGGLSQTYINAGGQLPEEPVESQLIGEQAVRMAWAARAISASGDSSISLW